MAAVFGVTGTLLAPVLSQRSQAKALAADFERQHRAAQSQWQREHFQREFEKRRACYIATNSAMRRYRVQLMIYLWRVRRDEVDDTARQELEEARHACHAAFAEAQMMASDPVLDQLDRLSTALGTAYGMTKDLEEGHPRPDGSFEEIGDYLGQFWRSWREMRSAMRDDLGTSGSSGGSPPTGSG
ncbi:hypothetical protein [Streptomyces panaciradicis]|uniref:hypothetical protein n=1 Tax=Streptomyces panaciradicis TaxID=1470261 RepID=UPI00201CAF1A|nr:hypothetical protein [Streptomyces panaciradicis]MCL6667699.1 hypothetical protein [Streptomyces panaciradicis]